MKIKIGLLIFIIAIIGAFFVLDLQQYATLDYIKEQQNFLAQYYLQNQAIVTFAFALIYVLVTALSLPFATVLTLISGALFGLIEGLIIASFASTIGATIAFLISRFIARDYVQKNYGKHLTKINSGFKEEGNFYLFALRLVPIFPFFIINLTTALMPIKTWSFYWVSQLGMLPGTAIYVYAGTQLAQINSLSDITSPSLLLAFGLLGIFPIATKKIIEFFRKKQP